MQRDLKAMLQLFNLFFIIAAQTFCQAAQGVFEVAVVVEVFNQVAQGRAIGVAQTQSQRLAQQKVRQRFLAARKLGGIGFIVAVVVAGGGVAAPF